MSPRRRACGRRTLEELHASPDDARLQGKTESVLESVMADDPAFADRLLAIVEDLARHQPREGVVIRDAGPVALHGNVTIEGHTVAGRDMTIGSRWR